MGLANRVADYYPQRINMYCPRMQYHASIRESVAAAFSLGTPAAADNDIIDNDIDADAVADTETAQSWTADSPYGRTLTMNANADPGAGGVCDVYGFDYLGQPMVERFTFVSGSTALLYGKKAFYRVTKTKIVSPCANATTYDLGTGYRLGLPFRPSSLNWVKENGVIKPYYGNIVTLRSDWADADVTAGMSHFLRTPVPGYISAIRGISDGGGSTTDPIVTIELGGVAVTGLTVTVDTSAAGDVVSDTPTTAGYNANNRLIAGDVIEIVSTAAASAGSMSIEVDVYNNQFVLPDMTDPATATTGDPRGTFESIDAFDGTKEFIVSMFGDPSLNASNNGGLHGIRHYYA